MKKPRLLALVPLFLACCASAPRVVSYFVDRGVMQYFLMPSTFHGNDATLSIDFAVRVGADEESPVICNFTIKARKDLPRRINRAHFRLLDKGEEIELRDISLLFIEKKANEVRATSTMDAGDFRKLLLSEDVTLAVESDAKEYLFTPARGFYRTIKDAGMEIIDES